MADNLDLDPCPGCDRDIDITAIRCPHCHYDLMSGKPAKKPKAAKVKAAKETTAKSTTTATTVVEETPAGERKAPAESAGYERCAVPALGRLGGDISMPELRFEREPTDENFIEWGENVRAAYLQISGYWLLNHGIGYFAMMSKEKVLKDNYKHIVELMGGEDYEF